MTGPRTLLLSGAALLVATAGFHLTGLEMAKGWLDGPRGTIVGLLWALMAFDWLIVAAIWIYAGVRRAPMLRWPVVLSALIPGASGALLLALVDAGHPGGYMLLGSAALASTGAWRLGNDLGRAS